MDSQGDVALQLEFDHQTSQANFVAYQPLQDSTYETIQKAYLFACDESKIKNHVQEAFLTVTEPRRDVLETAVPPENPIEVFNVSTKFVPTNYENGQHSPGNASGGLPAVDVFVKSKKKHLWSPLL